MKPILRHVAYHEAGHAVVARILGCNLQYVAAFHASDTGRGTAVPVNTSDDPATNYERMAKIKLAGPSAQMRKFKMAARKVERHANDGQWGPRHGSKGPSKVCRSLGQ
jgi:hypothetical protein